MTTTLVKSNAVTVGQLWQSYSHLRLQVRRDSERVMDMNRTHSYTSLSDVMGSATSRLPASSSPAVLRGQCSTSHFQSFHDIHSVHMKNPWLRKLLDITLQLPILVSISMVNLQCFRPAAYPFSSAYYPSLSKIHKLDSILCLVVPEHGSNSSCTSRTKLRLMPAYTHGDFMAFKSLPDLKSSPPSTDFPGIGQVCWRASSRRAQVLSI